MFTFTVIFCALPCVDVVLMVDRFNIRRVDV